MTKQSESPLGYAEIVSIVGHMDDEYITRIIDSGATANDVMEAFVFFNAEEAIGPDPKHQMTVNVARVYEILLSAQDGDEDRRD